MNLWIDFPTVSTEMSVFYSIFSQKQLMITTADI